MKWKRPPTYPDIDHKIGKDIVSDEVVLEINPNRKEGQVTQSTHSVLSIPVIMRLLSQMHFEYICIWKIMCEWMNFLLQNNDTNRMV